jgi:hypothetical protein
MKTISIFRPYTLEAFDGPTASITPELVDSIYKIVDKNKLHIIEASLDIEQKIERIILFYFFGEKAYDTGSPEKFHSLILTSDWCSFSSKRKLLLHINDENKVFLNKEKEDFEKSIRKVISYRNAFTHGSFSTDGRIVKLRYFEGTPQIKTLDDEYLEKIESTLKRCWNQVDHLSVSIGAQKQRIQA